MVNEKLLNFLCEETTWEDLGNENLLYELPEFGESVGASINNGTLIEFTKELSSLLEKMDLYKASLLSNFIGFACQEKEDTSAGRGVIELFACSCTNVYELFQRLEATGDKQLPDSRKEIFEENPDQARAYEGFNILCVSAMAFLSRDASLRNFLSELNISEQIMYLSEETEDSPYLKSVHYVNQILYTCSDYKFLVLFPKKKTGFFATANDLSNCFHLLFLMEEQIYKKLGAKYDMHAFHASKSLTSLAHGDYPDDCWNESYTTHYTECNYATAFQEEFGTSMATSLIWGEMPPQAIPAIDGRGIIILFENGLNRGFSAQFLATPHDALNPYVEIEQELSDTEYNAWMEKIKNRL